MKNKYTSPHRKIVIKTRLTDTEKLGFDNMLKKTNLPQSEYIRQSIFNTKIDVIVKPQISTEAIKKLLSEYGKIGSNLNQIAKYYNEGGVLCDHINEKLIFSLNELIKIKFTLLKIVGESYGNN